jgi:hypothetical protein
MQEICTSGLMRGHWKRGMGEIVWHRRETRRTTEKTNFALNHRASALLYLRFPTGQQLLGWVEDARTELQPEEVEQP